MARFPVKTLVSSILSILLFSNIALADCDFSKIQKVDGGYLYTKELHLCVGEMKQDLEIEQKRTVKLSEALTLKDTALDRANQRADLWMQTSFKLEDRVNTIDELRSRNQYLYFGLGMLTMFAATYAAGQINNR